MIVYRYIAVDENILRIGRLIYVTLTEYDIDYQGV
jgi:hypothetical protein